MEAVRPLRLAQHGLSRSPLSVIPARGGDPPAAVGSLLILEPPSRKSGEIRHRFLIDPRDAASRFRIIDQLSANLAHRLDIITSSAMRSCRAAGFGLAGTLLEFSSARHRQRRGRTAMSRLANGRPNEVGRNSFIGW